MFEHFGYEWDETKSSANREKHGLDFPMAIGIFAGVWAERKSTFAPEERWIAIGMLDGREIVVVFTKRGSNLRLISARRARPNERRNYHLRVGS